MDGVTSRDGTRIAFERSGAGPALLIVGGALADHRFYAPLADRAGGQLYGLQLRPPWPWGERRHGALRGRSGGRGRGRSHRPRRRVGTRVRALSRCGSGAEGGGRGPERREAGTGRSALRSPRRRRRGGQSRACRAGRTHTRTERVGRLRGSVRYFLKDYGLSDEDLEAMLRSPAGEGMLDCARALPHDYAVLGDGLVPTELAARADVPTTILAAGSMPETARALADAMPDARFRAMEASAHELPPEVMATDTGHGDL